MKNKWRNDDEVPVRLQSRDARTERANWRCLSQLRINVIDVVAETYAGCCSEVAEAEMSSLESPGEDCLETETHLTTQASSVCEPVAETDATHLATGTSLSPADSGLHLFRTLPSNQYIDRLVSDQSIWSSAYKTLKEPWLVGKLPLKANDDGERHPENFTRKLTWWHGWNENGLGGGGVGGFSNGGCTSCALHLSVTGAVKAVLIDNGWLMENGVVWWRENLHNTPFGCGEVSFERAEAVRCLFTKWGGIFSEVRWSLSEKHRDNSEQSPLLYIDWRPHPQLHTCWPSTKRTKGSELARTVSSESYCRRLTMGKEEEP